MPELDKIKSAFRQFKILWINPVLRAGESGGLPKNVTLFDSFSSLKMANAQGVPKMQKAAKRTIVRGAVKGAVTAPIGIPVLAATAVVCLPFICAKKATRSALGASTSWR